MASRAAARPPEQREQIQRAPAGAQERVLRPLRGRISIAHQPGGRAASRLAPSTLFRPFGTLCQGYCTQNKFCTILRARRHRMTVRRLLPVAVLLLLAVPLLG